MFIITIITIISIIIIIIMFIIIIIVVLSFVLSLLCWLVCLLFSSKLPRFDLEIPSSRELGSGRVGMYFEVCLRVAGRFSARVHCSARLGVAWRRTHKWRPSAKPSAARAGPSLMTSPGRLRSAARADVRGASRAPLAPLAPTASRRVSGTAPPQGARARLRRERAQARARAPVPRAAPPGGPRTLVLLRL